MFNHLIDYLIILFLIVIHIFSKHISIIMNLYSIRSSISILIIHLFLSIFINFILIILTFINLITWFIHFISLFPEFEYFRLFLILLPSDSTIKWLFQFYSGWFKPFIIYHSEVNNPIEVNQLHISIIDSTLECYHYHSLTLSFPRSLLTPFSNILPTTSLISDSNLISNHPF